MNNIIEVSALQKSFKGQRALDGLNLSVPEGSIFGFLGRNGAGKTTTIKTLMGLLRPDSGEARVFGIAVADAGRAVEIRRRIGFVTEDKELYPYMTVEQIIREVSASRISERGATRADDRFSETAMEDRKREGYF